MPLAASYLHSVQSDDFMQRQHKPELAVSPYSESRSETRWASILNQRCAIGISYAEFEDAVTTFSM